MQMFPMLARRLAALLLAMTIAVPALAADVAWQPLAALGAADRATAERALADLFGDNPEWWPDWLEPQAVLVPAHSDLLVVRAPLRAPCGQYQFTVFGPARADGNRDPLGAPFCAGALTVVPVAGRDLPDLLFSEGRRQDPDSGGWQRDDQRVRWTGRGWVRLLE